MIKVLFSCARQYRILLGLVLLLSARIQAEGYYIEAESVEPDSPWVFENIKEGYTGDGYLHWVQGRRGEGELVYEFDITTAGTYEVWLRGRRDHEGVCEDVANDRCNDVFTKMNDGPRCKTMVKGSWGRWIWEARVAECSDAHKVQCGRLSTHGSGVEHRRRMVRRVQPWNIPDCG